jgi:quercetin dioxygenase-like cupin family protein
MNIAEELLPNDEKPAVIQVKNTDKLQVIAISLKKGQVLKKHITPIPATLIVLKGLVAFDMEGTITELPVYTSFEIPVNSLHEVTGLEESLFLVIKEK